MGHDFRVGDYVRMRCKAHLLVGHVGRILKLSSSGMVFVKFPNDHKRSRWCFAVHLEHESLLDRLARV